jgi:hypothetical protein
LNEEGGVSGIIPTFCDDFVVPPNKKRRKSVPAFPTPGDDIQDTKNRMDKKGGKKKKKEK